MSSNEEDGGGGNRIITCKSVIVLDNDWQPDAHCDASTPPPLNHSSSC